MSAFRLRVYFRKVATFLVVFVLLATLAPPAQPAAAAIAQSGSGLWTQHLYNTAYPAGTITSEFHIDPGWNRLLVVAIASTRYDAAGSPNCECLLWWATPHPGRWRWRFDCYLEPHVSVLPEGGRHPGSQQYQYLQSGCDHHWRHLLLQLGLYGRFQRRGPDHPIY